MIFYAGRSAGEGHDRPHETQSGGHSRTAPHGLDVLGSRRHDCQPPPHSQRVRPAEPSVLLHCHDGAQAGQPGQLSSHCELLQTHS